MTATSAVERAAPRPEESIPTTWSEQSGRYVFLDALRGLAALGVLMHHMLHSSVMEVTLRRVLPGWLTLASEYGMHGVQVFFVLSGFVIAHSLRSNPLSPRDVGNFILRRQVRLDPPYWAMLVFVLALGAAERMVPGLLASPAPTVGATLLNFFYLQFIAGLAPLLEVSWTLCIEIQFYLVFIALMVASRWWQARLSPGTGVEGLPRIAALPVAALGLLSLWSIHHGAYNAWFIQYWFYFAAGVLCYWSLGRRVHDCVFLGFCVAFALSGWKALAGGVLRASDTLGHDNAMVVGLGTCLLLFALGRAGKLRTWSGGGALQYFGRVSYSLYLTHLPILQVILRAGYKITGEREMPALGWFVLAWVCCLLACHVFYCLVERPSIRWGVLLKRPVKV